MLLLLVHIESHRIGNVICSTNTQIRNHLFARKSSSTTINILICYFYIISTVERLPCQLTFMFVSRHHKEASIFGVLSRLVKYGIESDNSCPIEPKYNDDDDVVVIDFFFISLPFDGRCFYIDVLFSLFAYKTLLVGSNIYGKFPFCY